MSVVVDNVTKIFGKQKALDNISFKINTGEILGILGPNGAGKTTIMRIITGFLPPSSGKVYINGKPVGDNKKEIKKHIGYLPENNPLYPDMYVKEYLQFVAALYKTGEKRRITDDIIELTGLTAERHKKIGNLSKGYRQRVGLAQVLIHDPEVLILDEPTSGLDPNQIIEIRNLISDAGKEKTVMLSTHIMREVEAICHRIIIINNGKIVADRKADSISAGLVAGRQAFTVEFSEHVEESSLLKIPNAKKAVMIKDNLWIIESSGNYDLREAIFNFAVENNIAVLSLQKQEKSLEETFQELTKDDT